MERLTEHYGDRYIRIKGCNSFYPREERKSAPASNAVVRLAAYEDTELSPEEIERRMTLRTEAGQRLEIIRDIPTGRLRELVQEYQNGKIQPMSCAGCRYDQTFSLEEHNTHCMRCIRNRYPDDHYTGAGQR